MTDAIRKHMKDVVAIVVLAAIGIGVGGYILSNQRLRFPFIEEKPFELKAEFSDAQAVIPGQGQTVRVAGMKVGDISKVELKEGRAIVTMALDRKYSNLVHADATALLRPRTGLKDMFIALDPGTKARRVMDEGEVIPSSATSPDIDADEILRALDRDTRAYLKLLINGAGKGLAGRGGDLREVFKRLSPLQRDLARVNGALAERRRNLRRLVHNYSKTVTTLGAKDKELAQLVSASNEVFGELAQEDRQISLAVSRLPSTLSQARRTLARVDQLGRIAGPAFTALRPAIRRLAPANAQVRPFAREAEPILRRDVRPFVRAARPVVRDLSPAARDLAKASPDLRESFFELNRLFNMLSYNPGGRERLAGNDPDREEGYLFWLGWLGQNTTSVFSTADASGPYRRGTVHLSCSTLRAIVQGEPAAEQVLGVTNLLNSSLCPPS